MNIILLLHCVECFKTIFSLDYLPLIVDVSYHCVHIYCIGLYHISYLMRNNLCMYVSCKFIIFVIGLAF